MVYNFALTFLSLPLHTIFDGCYGSNSEQALGKELNWLVEVKHHVDQAHFRWSRARTLISEASTLVGEAITKWSDMPSIAPENLNKRYIIAAETRNLLVIASRNVDAALRYLPNIELPICSMNETRSNYLYFHCHDDTWSLFTCDSMLYFNTQKSISGWIKRFEQQLFVSLQVQGASKVEQVEHLIALDSSRAPVTGLISDSDFDSKLEESIKPDETSRQFSETHPSKTSHVTNVPLVMPTAIASDLPGMPSDEEIFGSLNVLFHYSINTIIHLTVSLVTIHSHR